MDRHIREYFSQFSEKQPHANFHSVISLTESPDITWESLKEKMGDLGKGWYELAHLNAKDRIEFTCDFWLSKLPYRHGIDEFIRRFFASLDDVAVFITQKKSEDLPEAHLVYSIKGNNGFFRGALPISEKKMHDLQKFFADFILPQDYLAFLQIHNGFCKTTDCTGVVCSDKMPQLYVEFQAMTQEQEPMITSQGKTVDPKTLIPFYESFGMPFFQCFWSEWYPEQEMGNVYYSGEAKMISDVFSGAASSEIMAFPTFMDWLMFYLEPFPL